MRKQKKQLLGFAGLALVAGMTVFACNLPTNAVSTTGGDADVYVRVYSHTFETRIEAPLDGQVFTDNIVSFAELHSKANNVKYYLTHVGENGYSDETFELTEYEVSGVEVDGRTEFNLNLDTYGGFGTYIFKSVITSSTGRTQEDSVKFRFEAIYSPDEEIVSDPSKDTIDVDVYYSAGVKLITFEIQDKNGNRVSRVFGHIASSQTSSGRDMVALNIGNLGIESGEYVIVIKGYDNLDQTGNPIGTDSVKLIYTAPDSPNVPNTGSLLAALNISSSDFLVTGIIGFIAISVISLFVIKRANRK
ncbi:hypothetical protein IJH16_01480 [Candidatus Saccharibacteria bacterium]|nr:hypothetical protein [Candidatus Saccharibacteria bacterium]